MMSSRTEDVAVGQIAELGIDRDDVAALDEQFSRHEVVPASFG
jgi:hypothetical protein